MSSSNISHSPADEENSKTSKRRRLLEEEDETTDIADLAPFVAAVLRDRTVEDLVRENQRLRSENQRFRDRFRVTILDPNGTTLAEADDLTKHIENIPSDGKWLADVEHAAVKVDFESIGPLEIKVGNRTVETISPADFRVCDLYFANTLSCDIGLDDRPAPCVPWCWIMVHPSREEKELPDAFWDIMDQRLGLVELLRQLKNIDPGISVTFDRIGISIRAEQLLMQGF